MLIYSQNKCCRRIISSWRLRGDVCRKMKFFNCHNNYNHSRYILNWIVSTIACNLQFLCIKLNGFSRQTHIAINHKKFPDGLEFQSRSTFYIHSPRLTVEFRCISINQWTNELITLLKHFKSKWLAVYLVRNRKFNYAQTTEINHNYFLTDVIN